MKPFSKINLATPAAVGALALSLMAATPADAQNRYRTYDRDQSSQTGEVLIGAAIGALAGALLGNGDGTYVAGGALAGAAIGASAGNNDTCSYYRSGQCYRNQGHWEREHGINSRDGYGYGYSYGNGYGNDDRYSATRTSSRQRENCSYYRSGKCYRNQGHWEREHGIDSRDYRYQSRW